MRSYMANVFTAKLDCMIINFKPQQKWHLFVVCFIPVIEVLEGKTFADQRPSVVPNMLHDWIPLKIEDSQIVHG